jgi:O-antigen ligase
MGLLLMAAASYFTFTRSWAIAMVPALGVMALLYRGQYSKEFWIIIVVIGAGLWYWSDMQSSRYTQDTTTDSSAAARPVLWTVGLNIAADHPWLGVGHESFKELSPQYANTVDKTLLERADAKHLLGAYTPHNDPLNIWLSWGFFALFVYAALTIVIGKNFFVTFGTTPDPLLKGLALGGLAALIGFQVNSFFHNFLDSTLTFWVLAGFSLVLLKLGPRARPPAPKPKTPPPPVMVRNTVGEWEECAV